VCLGQFAWNLVAPRPRPPFGHGAEARAGRYALLGCFHPSQQNTFTGKLTAPMIETVLRRARELADEIAASGGESAPATGDDRRVGPAWP
jgi:uracil-DNA glycosylase